MKYCYLMLLSLFLFSCNGDEVVFEAQQESAVGIKTIQVFRDKRFTYSINNTVSIKGTTIFTKGPGFEFTSTSLRTFPHTQSKTAKYHIKAHRLCATEEDDRELLPSPDGDRPQVIAEGCFQIIKDRIH